MVVLAVLSSKRKSALFLAYTKLAYKRYYWLSREFLLVEGRGSYSSPYCCVCIRGWVGFQRLVGGDSVWVGICGNPLTNQSTSSRLFLKM